MTALLQVDERVFCETRQREGESIVMDSLGRRETAVSETAYCMEVYTTCRKTRKGVRVQQEMKGARAPELPVLSPNFQRTVLPNNAC